MDTSPASHSISLPQVSLGPQPTTTTMASLSPSASPNHQQQQHHHHHNLSHSRSCCADMDHTQHHSNNNTHPHTNNININNKSKSTTRMSRSFSHSRAYGLSLREQQQIRNQQMNLNNNNSSTNNNNPLSLNIIPPKFMTNFYPIDESSCPSSSSMDSSFSQFNGSNSNNINDHQQSGSNNSFLGTSSQDSLGSSLSRHGSTGNTPRRASFNLSTGSLRNFNSGASPSLASPSSPSYSTIAVARARAAAAATAAATAGATEGGSGSSQGAGRDGLGIVGSGVFPGGGALGQNSFSSAPSSSSSTSSSVPSSSDLYLNSKQPSNSYESNGVPQPNSLGSSASSLTSNDSVLNGGMATATAGSSTSPLPASSLPTSQSHHLQDNANAERQISMILDNFLYLGGDLVDEEQIDELERLGIKRVLNMAINCDDLLWIKRAGKDNGSYLKVGLLDHVDQDLKAGLDIATKFIGSSSSPVYVHCQAGKSRSVATVIGYLIQEHKWPLKKAYDHVVERRRIMSPNIGFVSQLIMLEERVLGPEKAGGLVSTANSDEELDPASRTTVVPWMNS